MAMACSPDEQNRLTVTPGTSMGRPAWSQAFRPMFSPCSPSGKAQPMMTSSTSAGSKPGALSSAALMTNAARSSGRVVRYIPRGALPTGIRTALTTTASLIE